MSTTQSTVTSTPECPDQVTHQNPPSTYEKEGGLVRLKEGMKKLVGKGTRGIGPKHSRAKPAGITGKQHAEETAKDMFNLHDAMHVGLENQPEQHQQQREVPIEHRGTDASNPKNLLTKNNQRDQAVAPISSSGPIVTSDDGSMNQIQDKVADRDLDQPSDHEIIRGPESKRSSGFHESPIERDQLAQESIPSTGVSRTSDTYEDVPQNTYPQSQSTVSQSTLSASIPRSGIPPTDMIGEQQRHDLSEDTKAQVQDTRREEALKDPAEGLTPAVRQAFIEDQRDRAILGDKFERGRVDHSKEAEAGLGQKLLAGITTATQGIKSVATSAASMITGAGSKTTETGTYNNETDSTGARKDI